eukprot:g2640.t1
MAKDDKDREIVEKIAVHPVPNNLLTVLFVAEIVGVAYVLHGEEPWGFQLKMYVSCTIGMIGLIFVVKRGAIMLGQWISRTCLRHPPFNDPIGKRKTAEKLGDQVWQLVVHVSMAAMEWAVLADEDWYADPKQVWIPAPAAQGTQKPLLRYLYIMQLAVWVGTCISHRWLEELHKDYYVMYIHHIATIALLLGSWYWNYHRVGVLVLFVHDFSDVFADWLKISNYFNLAGPRALFLTEVSFAALLGSWFYYRLWVFPTGIIRITYWESIQYMNDAGPMNVDKLLDHWSRGGDALPKGYWSMCLLLTLLFFLHVYWFALFLRILYRIVNEGDTHQAGRQEYEGESNSDIDVSPAGARSNRKTLKTKKAD